MVAAAIEPSKLAFILLTGFLISAKSRASCPSGAIFPLTELDTRISELVYKPDDVFPKITWIENGSRFGCLCDFKLCVRLCCPAGYASTENGCELDDSKFSIADLLGLEKFSTDHHVFTDDPCPSNSIDTHLLDRNFRLLQNGSVHLEARSETVDLAEYCLSRTVDSRNYSVARCFGQYWTDSEIYFVVCTGVSVLFVLAAFFLYSVTPELNNLQGSICRSFLGSHIAGTLMLLTTVLFSTSNNYLSAIPDLFVDLAGIGLGYFFTACFLWMNVMSIDVWTMFRKYPISSRRDEKIKKPGIKARFVSYSIYVWVGSTVLILPPTFCIVSKYVYEFLNPGWELILAIWAILMFLSIVVCNTCLYVSTASSIRQRRNEARNLVFGVNKHREENEQWFKLHVKLFTVMAGSVMLDAVAFYWENFVFNFVMIASVGLQGFFVFLIFLWRDDVKRTFCKLFNGITRKLGSVRRRDTTTTILEQKT